MSGETPPKQRLLYTRRSAAELLDVSIDTVKALEERGALTPIRLNGERGLVHYGAAQLHALVQPK